MDTYRTRKGRQFMVLGDPALLTLDRLAEVRDRFDADPRVATVSLVTGRPTEGFLRATAPTGCVILVALDALDLVGEVDGDITSWSRRASDHGLWHDWLLDDGQDVARAATLAPPADMDLVESLEPSSSHYGISPRPATPVDPGARISMVVDITWLGPEQTGAQVLTTAALAALARNARVNSLTLVGRTELPTYAAHLSELERVELGKPPTSPADIVWYPNQIDQRSSIGRAREWGRRVITTYLDLIAYDIPRYHATPQAWGAYRSLQRKIALSVDGVTTISADVAERLCQEVPLLDRDRVQPIPLGLDHISAAQVPPTPDPGDGVELGELASSKRRFLVVLGNDFRHKNRDLAIRVWQRVRDAGEACDLVLAGLHVKSSSSRDAERAVMAAATDTSGRGHEQAASGRLIRVGHVSEGTRAWLLANAAVVLYPSSAEGFGFVPYEAAALGAPASFTAFGPLAEIADAHDVPRSWTVEAYTGDVLDLLRDEGRRVARVADLRRSIERHTWDRFADELVDFCQRIALLPEAANMAAGSGSADAAALAAVLSSRTWRATEPLRSMGRRLRGVRRR